MGPDSYPGNGPAGEGIISWLFGGEGYAPSRVRGLYGGSLWLEPSFHGQQWLNSRTGIGVSGMLWIDSGYETIKRDNPRTVDSAMTLQQGRGVLRLTPAYVNGRFFIQGQVELVGNLCQASNNGDQFSTLPNPVCQGAGTFDTDDLWIRVGHRDLWDLQIGRFQGWEVYHTGMGLEPYTLERLGAGMFGSTQPSQHQLDVPSLDAVNYLHDRPSDGLAVGYAALHAYFTKWLRLELLAKLGTDGYRGDASLAPGHDPSGPATYYGGRPTLIFDMGWLKLKLAGAYQKRTPISQELGDIGNQVTGKKDPVEGTVQKSASAAIQVVVDPYFEFGFNAGIGEQDATGSWATSDPDYTFTTKSVGGFGNFRLSEDWLVGLGGNWSTWTDGYKADTSTATNYSSELQAFVAVQYLLARRLYIKAVLDYATAELQPSAPFVQDDYSTYAWHNHLYGGRIRLMYIF